MSETFLSEIADQLRNQTPLVEPTPAPAPVEPTPAAPVEPAPAEPVTAPVNPQITDSVTTEAKEWWEQGETKTVEIAPVNQAEKTEPKFDLDDDLKLLAEYKKSGKSLADFVKEYQIEDHTQWNDEQIVKQGLKEFMNLTEEELEQANYEYDSASIFQKKQWAENFKQKFDAKNADKLKQLTANNKQTSEVQEAIAKKYEAELDNYSKEVVGKEVYGLKITDEMASDLKRFINEEFTLQREDGSFDIEKVYSVSLWMKYGRDLVKANITKARNEGKEQVIKEVSNPSKNMTAGGRSVGSGLEAAQEAFMAMFPG
jgi:hypothetical protein